VRARALLALLGVALLVLPARAQTIEIPRGTGWVNDTANVLPESERSALEARLAAFERKNGHEIALLTVPTTSGQPSERYALEVARAWKLGKPGKNDGALLVIAVQDRKLRIEVGRGLEGELTDLLSSRIIRDVIVPRLKQGDMPGGIRAGVEAMIAVAGGAGEKALPPARDSGGIGAGIGVLLFVIFLVIAIVLRRINGGGGGYGRRYRGGLFPFPMMIGGGGRGSGGGGFGGGGFGRGGGGFNGQPQDREAAQRMRDAMRQELQAPDHMTIVTSDTTIIITTPDGHTMRLAPDGKKIKDESTGVERKTKWDSGKLVSEVSGLGRGKITETYSIDGDAKQLHVTLDIDGPRKTSQTRVYDLDAK
jgi:uncharacterized protein